MITSIDIYKKLIEEINTGFVGGLLDFTIKKLSYHSNKIEGSTLTEEQTEFMYEHRSLIPDENNIPKLNDITEMDNHFAVCRYMIKNANQKLSEDLIKEYHKLLKKGTDDEKKGWAIGKYKTIPNQVGNVITTYPEEVKEDMENLLLTYNLDKNKSLKDIVDFHVRFETIHPFQDGNGRVGRLLMFKECLNHNVIPFIIEADNKDKYYLGLKEYYTNPKPLLEFAEKEQAKYMDISNSLINGKKEKELKLDNLER